MQKLDVEYELKSRELAKRFFGQYFSALSGKESYGYGDFHQKYFEYLESYFNGYYNSERRDYIKRAYNYINNIYKREHVISNDEIFSGLIERTWESYIYLIKAVACYSFYPTKRKSVGDSQNSVNNQILDQLSLFEPLVYNICISLNDEIEINEVITEELWMLANRLNDIQNELYDATTTYHDAWEYCVRPERTEEAISPSELGKYSKEWRLARNKACNVILNFVEEMMFLDKVNYYGTSDTTKWQYGLSATLVERINYYNDCLKYIEHSNNYFCYLDEDEKMDIAMQKLLRRKEK